MDRLDRAHGVLLLVAAGIACGGYVLTRRVADSAGVALGCGGLLGAAAFGLGTKLLKNSREIEQGRNDFIDLRAHWKSVLKQES
jgi:hypothetical protein